MKVISELILDLHRSCVKLGVEDFQPWAVNRLKQAIPFDAALWATGRMENTGAVIHSLHLANRPRELLADYEGVKQDDRFAYENAANLGRACMWNSLTERSDLAPGIDAYLRKWRISHAMACHVLDPVTGLLTAIALWREPGSAPFDEAARQSFEALMPHLIETNDINRIEHMVRAAQPRNAAVYSSAVADRDGRLQVAPEEFQHRLLAEWPQWSGHRLPPQLAHLAAGGAGSQFAGERMFFRSVAVNGSVLVQARERRPADALTPREMEIARLATGGLTYNEVAKRLAISPATVRNHLSAVYKKLRARKQAEIVSMLGEID